MRGPTLTWLAIAFAARIFTRERDFTILFWWVRSGHRIKDFVSGDVSDGLLRRHDNLVVVHFFTSGYLAVDLRLKSFRGSREPPCLW